MYKNECDVVKKNTHLLVSCKVETVTVNHAVNVNHDECLTSSVIEKLTGKWVEGSGYKMYMSAHGQ